MTIAPVIIFIAAILLALAFEIGYAFLDSKISLAGEQELWALLYWMAIGILGFSSGVIPKMPPFSSDWIGFWFVVAIHVFLNDFKPGVINFHQRTTYSHRGSGGRGGRPLADDTGNDEDLQKSQSENDGKEG